MGRPRIPTAVHEASGAYDKNPQRALDRIDEPRPTTPLGPPPEVFLSKYNDGPKLLAIWHELEAQMIEGVATGCDRFAFENLCRLELRCRSMSAKTGDFAQAKAYLSEFGLTPAGRTRVSARKAKIVDKRTPDGWAALAEERSQKVQ
jgi:hypothetical protein